MSSSSNRFIIAPPLWVFVLLISAWPAANAKAQIAGSLPDLAIEISPRFFYDLENEGYYGQFMYSRIASSLQIDPDAKGTGLARTAILSAGVRSPDLNTFDFRWRVGVIDMDLIRTPLSMGITLIDYDKSGFLEVDVRWVNLRLGPSIHIGNERSFFALRAVGTGGLTTIKMGDFAYAGLSTEEALANRKRSYEIGYLGEMRVLLANVVSLQAIFQYRNQLGGLRPNIYHLKGYLGFRLSRTLSLMGTFLAEETTASSSTVRRHGAGFVISLAY